MQAQRGFSLVEVTIAAAIGLVAGWQLLALIHTTMLGAAGLDAHVRARGAADRLEERLTSDAAGAWSIFVPERDVTGTPNADGHELDFVTEDAAHRSIWWAYAFDARTRRVTRYAYAPGSTPIAGETFDSVAGLAARVHPITDLAVPGSEAYDALFARATLVPVEIDFGWNRLAAGGNHIVRVHFTGIGVDRTLLLASATAPTHFTVILTYTPAPPTPTP